MSDLNKEVANFRRWATESGFYAGCGGEWECDYPDWQGLYVAVENFLQSAAYRLLASDELELLLFSLARDNEDEHVLELLENFPRIALQVARTGLNCTDVDARWQLAVLLGRIRSPDAVDLLQHYIADEAEYVRRRAKFALEEK